MSSPELTWTEEVKKYSAFYTILFGTCIALLTFLNEKYALVSIDKFREDELDKLEMIEKKMNSFKTDTNYLYFDADMILFLYSIRDLEDTNGVIFKELLTDIDNFLRLSHVTTDAYLDTIYDILKDLRTSILNTAHQFIFNGQSEKRISYIISQIDFLLQRHLYNFATVINDGYDDKGPLTTNRFIHLEDNTEPFDLSESIWRCRDMY